jgi:Sec7-like guanine-nucleotide exchange factor
MVEKGVLKYFMSTFEFEGMKVDDAFRLLLSTIGLPSSATKIQIITVHFSDRYFECNPNDIFATSGTLYL